MVQKEKESYRRKKEEIRKSKMIPIAPISEECKENYHVGGGDGQMIPNKKIAKLHRRYRSVVVANGKNYSKYSSNRSLVSKGKL